jgi:hypothetical protein
MRSRLLCLVSLAGVAALGCARATFHDVDAGTGSGGTSAGTGGRGGTAGGGGGTGGGAGTVIGGNGGGGVGGSAGNGDAGSGGSIGGAGRGGSTAGTGGATAGTGGGGAGGTAGTTGGRGGSGGTAGSAGTGGSAGAGGRGGTAGATAGTGGGTAGTGGGTAGTGGATGGTGGTGGGSAGTGGVAGVMPTVAGQIVITELMHDVPGNDDNSEWFEIHNPSTTVTFNLMGCDVGDFNTFVPITTSLVVPPGAFRTLGIAADVGFPPYFVYGTAIKFDSQGADSARIRCGTVLIDEFAYNSTDATDANSVSHTYSVDPRHYTAADNDIRANWCLATTPYMMGSLMLFGTPGATNPQCP